MGKIGGESSAEIAVAIESVYEIAADAEGAPRWQPEIELAECLERGADGNQQRVRIETETPVKRLTSILVYSYESPTQISWYQEEGDLKSVEGRWELTELGAGLTRATYKLEVDPGRILGMALRGPVVGVLRGKLVETMPGKLKAFAER